MKVLIQRPACGRLPTSAGERPRSEMYTFNMEIEANSFVDARMHEIVGRVEWGNQTVKAFLAA